MKILSKSPLARRLTLSIRAGRMQGILPGFPVSLNLQEQLEKFHLTGWTGVGDRLSR
ncbi:hypothetical protein ACN28S_47625 [Cystobacter fuscus]